MRRVADALGIRAPSIYKHLADKEALEDALISAGFAELAAAFEATLAPTTCWAGWPPRIAASPRAHPHLYRLMTDRPLRRDRLAPGVEQRAAAARRRGGRRRRRPRPRACARSRTG